MYGRVDQKLFIHQNHHILHRTEDFCLDSGWSVRFAESDEGTKNIYQCTVSILISEEIIQTIFEEVFKTYACPSGKSSN